MAEKSKRNKLRYFTPEEFEKFMAVVMNPKHEFTFELLLNTGARHHEAKNIIVKHIFFDRNYIELHKTKGGAPREVIISTRFSARLNKYIIQNKIKENDNLNVPSRQFLDKAIKSYAKKAELKNPEDFCCHSFRKTHENWLCALGVNTMLITKQIGHTITVADQYYVSQTKFNMAEKQRIRAILGDIFQVDDSTTSVNQSMQNSTIMNQQGGNFEGKSF